MSDGDPANGQPSLAVLHHSDTDMGFLMLRKRWSMALERDVFEMTIDGKLMMSSAMNVSERALADQVLALLPNRPLQVLIGGLGLGFTAVAALADERVERVTIIECLEPVIEWHAEGVFPWAGDLVGNPKVNLVAGDFFAFVADAPRSLHDAILIDIDDSPSLLWHHSHAAFYGSSGLEALKRHLRPDGIAALWSATHPGETFLRAAQAVFPATELLEVQFEDPCHRRQEANYLVLARAQHQ